VLAATQANGRSASRDGGNPAVRACGDAGRRGAFSGLPDGDRAHHPPTAKWARRSEWVADEQLRSLVAWDSKVTLEEYLEMIRDGVREELHALGVPDAPLSTAPNPSCLRDGPMTTGRANRFTATASGMRTSGRFR